MPFSPKTGRKFWAKIIPQSPLKGDVGNGFGGIDGAKISRYYARQAQTRRPRPSSPAPGGKSQANAFNRAICTTQNAFNRANCTNRKKFVKIA